MKVPNDIFVESCLKQDFFTPDKTKKVFFCTKLTNFHWKKCILGDDDVILEIENLIEIFFGVFLQKMKKSLYSKDSSSLTYWFMVKHKKRN